MKKVNLNWGKPTKLTVADRIVDIISSIMVLLVLVTAYIAWKDQIYQLLLWTPIVTAYVVILYGYLTRRFKKENEKLLKIIFEQSKKSNFLRTSSIQLLKAA